MNDSLSLAQILEKNKLYNSSVYVVLVEIRLSTDSVIRLCNDSKDIEWQGFNWVAFPFDLGDLKDSDGGETQEITLSVSNVLRVMQSYIEQAKGGVDTEVVLRVVNTETLDEAMPLVEEFFGVTETSIDNENISFKLGIGIPLFLRFPERRFLKNFCEFEYGGMECAVKSAVLAQYPICNRTLPDCEKRGNSRRFGGEPSIGQGGFYA